MPLKTGNTIPYDVRGRGLVSLQDDFKIHLLACAEKALPQNLYIDLLPFLFEKELDL